MAADLWQLLKACAYGLKAGQWDQVGILLSMAGSPLLVLLIFPANITVWLVNARPAPPEGYRMARMPCTSTCFE